jgi:hypothetical protein
MSEKMVASTTMYCAEQIVIPEKISNLLKTYAKGKKMLLYFILFTARWVCVSPLSAIYRTRFTKNENVFLLFGKIATAFIFMRKFAHSKYDVEKVREASSKCRRLKSIAKLANRTFYMCFFFFWRMSKLAQNKK